MTLRHRLIGLAAATAVTALGTTAVVVVATSSSASAAPSATSAPTAPAACAPWTVRTVLTGQGQLENLLPDGHGGMVLSVLDGNRLERVTPSGQVTTIATGLTAPGGLARRGDQVYVVTGDSSSAALLGTTDGTVARVNLTTGAHTIWASKLIAPNGLALLPDGSAVATRPLVLFGTKSAVTRTTGGDHPNLFWSSLTGTNGATLDSKGTWLYVSRSLAGEIWRIRVADPTQQEKVASVGAATFPDDLTVGPDGLIYVAGYLAGTVIRVDPATGATCTVATGLSFPTSVRAGDGTGFPTSHLYVTAHSGNLYELTPP